MVKFKKVKTRKGKGGMRSDAYKISDFLTSPFEEHLIYKESKRRIVEFGKSKYKSRNIK